MKISRTLCFAEDVNKWIIAQAKKEGRSISNYVGLLIRADMKRKARK